MTVQFSTDVRNVRLDAIEALQGGIVDGSCIWLPVGAGTGTAWAASTAYTFGQLRSNGGNLFLCVKGGTSASSGGPAGTSAAAPKLRIYSGSAPANCAAAATGTLLAEITCPADFYANASAGSKALSGSWTVAATAGGTAGYYRIVDNAGTTCHEQGTVTATGGGGDLTLDNVSIAASQVVTITSMTKTDGNP